MDFDASIDLLDAHFPAGCTPTDREATDRVRAAVSAIHGATYLSIEVHRGIPDSDLWLRLYEPGSSEEMKGGEWNDLAGRVEAVVQEALA